MSAHLTPPIARATPTLLVALAVALLAGLPILSPAAEAPPASALAATVDQALRDPRQPAPIQALQRQAAACSDKALAEPLLAAVALAWQLQQNSAAAEAVKALKQRFPQSAYLDVLTGDNLRGPCPACKGSGKAGVACKTCAGTGKCINSRCRGGNLRLELVSGDTVTQKCPVCDGTGRCKDCGGTGKTPTACPHCRGSGKLTAAEKVEAACKAALRDGRTRLEDQAGAGATARLLAVEADTRRLQGLALNEASKLLTAAAAVTLRQRHADQPAQADAALRELLNANWPALLRKLATDLLAQLSSTNRNTCERLLPGVAAEGALLDVLAVTGALDVATLHAAWSERGNLRHKTTRDLLARVFPTGQPPRREAGCVSGTTNAGKLTLTYFGASVATEIEPAATETMADMFRFGWRSDLDTIAQAFSPFPPPAHTTRSCERRDGTTNVHLPAVEFFAQELCSRSWALLLALDNPGTLRTGLRDLRALQAAGKPDLATLALNRRLLPPAAPATVHATLAAMPFIEAASGIGAGFLFAHGEKWYVATSRHLLAGAGNSVTLTFYGRNTDGLFQHRIEPGAATVAAVHPTADLAVLNVTASKTGLDAAGIQPLPLLGERAESGVGEWLFVPAHPAVTDAAALQGKALAGGTVLERVTVKSQPLSFTGSLPITAWSTGGPLLTTDGKVAAVAAVVCRKATGARLVAIQGGGISLALLTDLLEKPATGMNKTELAAFLAAPAGSAAEGTAAFRESRELFATMRQESLGNGCQLVPLAGSESETLLRLTGTAPAALPLAVESGREYTVLAAVPRGRDIDFAVVAPGGDILAAEADVSATLRLTFRPATTGRVALYLWTPVRQADTIAILGVFDRDAPR